MLETQRATSVTSERACHRHLQVRIYPLGTTIGLEQRPVQVPNPPTIGAQRISVIRPPASGSFWGWLARPPGITEVHGGRVAFTCPRPPGPL